MTNLSWVSNVLAISCHFLHNVHKQRDHCEKNIVYVTEIIIFVAIKLYIFYELQMTYIALGSQFNIILVLTVYLAGITFFH
jgi:hypothetical protein